MTARPTNRSKVPVSVYEGSGSKSRRDMVVTEEPLEIRVVSGHASETVAVTMRTPGHDFELAVGFLFAEGVITTRDQVTGISYCRDEDLPPEQLYNIVIVEMVPGTVPDLASLERHFHVSSACGVCGKASLEALALRGIKQVGDGPTVAPEIITSLPERLRTGQKVFESTGGLHAAGLFDPAGNLVALREDVGRHNALDKLIGWALLEGRIPLTDHIIMVSGRSSFEIAQKAAAAGVPFVCSVSAPSNLAIDVATEFGMTLVGFLRGDRFNVYSHADRIAP